MINRIKDYAAILVFAALVWCFWFVWPGVVRSADTPLMPTTYDTSVLGVDYATMQDWVAAKMAINNGDFVAEQRGQVLIIPGGTYASWCEIPENNTSPAYCWVIKAADGEVVNFVPTSLDHVGNYVNAFNYSFAVWASHTRIIGINADWTGLEGIHNDWLKVAFLVHSDVTGVRIVNCSGKNVTAPSYIGAAFAAFSAGTTDIGVINFGAAGCDYGVAYFNGSGGFVYNGTIKDCINGYYSNSATIAAKNCLAAGNTTDWGGTWSKTSCLDAVPTWASGTDFDIDPGDTTVLGEGDDLSADATFAFSYDRNNDTRPTLWSVGADDAAAVEPEPEPETPSVRYAPWGLGPWGAGPWNGGNMGRWN